MLAEGAGLLQAQIRGVRRQALGQSHNRVWLRPDPLDGLPEELAPEDDPFEVDDARTAALELADRVDLSPEGRRTLFALVVPASEGLGATASAHEAGVSVSKRSAMLRSLRSELELRGYGEADALD